MSYLAFARDESVWHQKRTYTNGFPCVVKINVASDGFRIYRENHASQLVRGVWFDRKGWDRLSATPKSHCYLKIFFVGLNFEKKRWEPDFLLFLSTSS